MSEEVKETVELCGYKPDRFLSYYVSALSGILGPLRHGEKSTHAYVKEVRKALEELLFSFWDKADEMIPIIADSNIPDDLKSPEARKCFRELIAGMLTRFREVGDKLPIGARIRLMNMITAALANIARSKQLSPVGKEIADTFFKPKSDKESEGEAE
ncbi:MAG: hypothetical protein B7L53_01185 [Thermofilum sp. NZ13]|nr:MAG: hypothetical protein B7L53_01185 [Thermofilum sp. NZ13]